MNATQYRNGYTSHNGHNGYHRSNGTAAKSAITPDRLPPQNREAERGALGGCLLDNLQIDDLMLFLKPEDFYRDSHIELCRVIYALRGEGRPVDYLTVMDEMERRETWEKSGGTEWLAEIMESIPHAANTQYYGQIVRQKAVTRQVIEAANKMLADAYSEQQTAEQLLEGAEQSVFAIADRSQGAGAVLIGERIDEAYARMDRRKAGEVTGLGTGFPDLDDKTGGFQPAQLIVLAARPAMGKTAMALNVADHTAHVWKLPTLFVSLEMGESEVVDRVICARARIESHLFRGGMLSSRQIAQAKALRSEIIASPLHIADTLKCSVTEISALARRIKRRSDLGLVVVDYIQLIETGGGKESRAEQIGQISRGLKRLARELKLPVVALSQLNRQVENREDRRPRMADLRESGSIEQDADIVLLLYRPDYYDENDKPGIAIVDVAKNRNGRTGPVELVFQKEFMRFDSLARHGGNNTPDFGPVPAY